MKEIKGEVKEATSGIEEKIEKAKKDLKETASLDRDENKENKGGDAKGIESEKESGSAES